MNRKRLTQLVSLFGRRGQARLRRVRRPLKVLHIIIKVAEARLGPRLVNFKSRLLTLLGLLIRATVNLVVAHVTGCMVVRLRWKISLLQWRHDIVFYTLILAQ